MTTISRSTDATTITPTTVLNEWTSENEPGSIVHRILGRPDVDITLRPAHDRTGAMKLLFWDHASAEAARVFHLAAAVFTTTSDLSWVPAAYAPNGPIQLTQQGKRWVLEVPYQELAP